MKCWKNTTNARKDAINTTYDKAISTIESKLSDGVMTDSEAELKKNLTELKKAQKLAILETAREQRQEEIRGAGRNHRQKMMERHDNRTPAER